MICQSQKVISRQRVPLTRLVPEQCRAVLCTFQ